MGQDGLSPLAQVEVKRERRLVDFDLERQSSSILSSTREVSFQCETRPPLQRSRLLPSRVGCNSKERKVMGVRFATAMDSCHLKNSTLEKKCQMYKGRVVLRGDIVKDGQTSWTSSQDYQAFLFWTSKRCRERTHPSRNERRTRNSSAFGRALSQDLDQITESKKTTTPGLN